MLPERFQHALTWRGVRRLAIELAVFGAPAYLLSRHLMLLTGGALWVPPEWRRIVLALGLSGGLALFHLARNHVERACAPVATSSSPRPSKMRKALKRAMQQRLEADSFAQRRALGWLILTVVAVLFHTLLRAATVQTWTPEPAVVAALAEVEVSSPMYLSSSASPVNGSFLFPLWFPTSARGRDFVREVQYSYTDGNEVSVRSEAIDHRLLDLVDIIRDNERVALALTQSAFVLAHLLVLFAASIAYGYSYSWAEEVAGNLRDLLQ